MKKMFCVLTLVLALVLSVPSRISAEEERGVDFYNLPSEMRIMSPYDSLDSARRSAVYRYLPILGVCTMDVLTGVYAARVTTGTITMAGSMTGREFIAHVYDGYHGYYVNYFDSYGYTYNDQDAVVDGEYYEGESSTCASLWL